MDLEELRDRASNTIPGFYERLVSWLPSLREHRCGLGVPGGFLMRLQEGTYPAHILEHVAIELENLAGTPVGFGKARETSQPGVYRVVIRYREEAVGRACLEAALKVVLAAIRGDDLDVQGVVKGLKSLAQDVCLGPSTMATIEAAEARRIPWLRLNDGSLVQLGYGARQHRIWTTETDRTSAIAEGIAQDKEATRQVLRLCGVKVPEGRAVQDKDAAWAAAEEIGLPVVVKPRDGNHGRGVFLNLTTREQVCAAFDVAVQEGEGVLVEQFLPGYEHRLLVVNGIVVAAARGMWAHVVGDGRSTVLELVEAQLNSDPRRGHGDDCPLNPVDVDSIVLMELKGQGLTPDSVPKEGQKVLIQRNGNLSDDVTDLVHPEVASMAAMAARAVGLDVAGVDIVTPDISRPLEEVGGAVVEVNAGPALHPHLMPANSPARPVGAAILKTLYPEGENGRIPIVCVTGQTHRGKVALEVARMLRQRSKGVGLASADGLYLDERRLARGDHANLQGARQLLMNRRVSMLVAEAHPQGILEEGLGFDGCSVAVVTDIGRPEFMDRFVQTEDDMFTVERCPVDIVLPDGVAVLDATVPLLVEMAPLCAGEVIYVSPDPCHPVIQAHLRGKGRAVVAQDGAVVAWRGDEKVLVVEQPSDEMMVALFSVAAVWAIGARPEEISTLLTNVTGLANTVSGAVV